MRSTRSNNDATSSQAILQGLSPDGGLFVFDQIDERLYQRLEETMSYSEVAHIVFSSVLDDYSEQQIERVISHAYDSGLFQPNVVGVKTLEEVSYLELYHGPTFAFKDLALSVLPQLFEEAKIIQQISKPTVIVTATSGDTGSAALAGFSQLPNTYVIVLYPKDGVSPFQEQQMNAYQNEYNTILAVEGNFDDCQTIAKTIFQTLHPEHVLLSSANSINIGRIIPQIVYYLYTHLSLQRDGKIKKDEPVNITVPTGNFGNIYAAYLAYRMGLPVHKLIVASNQNNVLTEVFQNQEYQIDRPLYPSYSPSMDIVVSSNLERYLYHLYDENPAHIHDWMTTLRDKKRIQLPNINRDNLFVAGYATEDNTLQEIKQVFDQSGYLMDPHTAVASYVHRQYQKNTSDDTHTIIASTASPYKFVDAMLMALDLSKVGNVQDKMMTLETATSIPMDSRIQDVLKGSYEPDSVSIEEAIQRIKMIVGEIR